MRNSGGVVSFVHSVALSDEVLVSFDAVSLFTKAPIDLALNVARKHLESDEALCKLTGLLIASVMSLLSFCLNATYFSFRGVFHKQMFSTAMGSPISVVVANLAMESIESRALSTFPSPPPRYFGNVMWTTYALQSSQKMFYPFSGTSPPSILLSSLLVRGKTSAATDPFLMC